MSALRSYVLDPLERAGSTFVQQFVVVLWATAGGSVGLLVSQHWLVAVESAGFAAIVSVLTSVLTFPVPRLAPSLDLLLRVLKTGLQSFLGVLAADQFSDIVHTDWRGALGVAVPVMFTAFLKGLTALALPTTDGASLLPHEIVSPDPYAQAADDPEFTPQGGTATAGAGSYAPEHAAPDAKASTT